MEMIPVTLSGVLVDLVDCGDPRVAESMYNLFFIARGAEAEADVPAIN